VGQFCLTFGVCCNAYAHDWSYYEGVSLQNQKLFLPKGFFMRLPKGLSYSYLMCLNFFSRSNLDFKRITEPSSITDEQVFVDDYNRASNSIMMLPYVLVLQSLKRILGAKEVNKVVDLCCGPGHFTRLLAKQMGMKNITGVDLSGPMLKYAGENATKENLSQKLKFLNSDVTNLEGMAAASVDLVTWLNGAHHFTSIEEVSKVLSEAERVTKPEGLIFVLDPVRQKNKKISDMYHALSGADYVKKDMSYFYIDFYNSLLASWKTDEFIEAIPNDTTRDWVQVVPFGLPSFQLLIGLPRGQKELFAQEGMSKASLKSLIPKESWFDWLMFNFTFSIASIRWIRCP
jgi:ubiquinone/menaquinone biosynthesis C-methylase UbiE